MKMKPIYRKIYEQAKPFLRTRKNLIHTKIAYRYALRLLEQENGEEEIVIPAILLHDVGWDSVPKELQLTAFGPNLSNPALRKFHEEEGAKRARKILNGLKYPIQKVKEICRIILGHDSRKTPVSWNDRIVKDADKLFRYSKKGFSIDVTRFNASPRKYVARLEDTIDHWFLTPTGKEIATKEIYRRKREY